MRQVHQSNINSLPGHFEAAAGPGYRGRAAECERSSRVFDVIVPRTSWCLPRDAFCLRNTRAHTQAFTRNPETDVLLVDRVLF